ncbi:MAG: polymer-forming cytoskeletal protein [Exilibacterium sp.]
MWGKKSDLSFSNNHTVIARGTEVAGDIRFDGELHVEGKICGNIIVAEKGGNAKVTVAEKGVVEGEIRVPTIVINGTVVGDVHASSHIELAAKAVVQGDVHYSMIEMVKGSQVNGNLVFNGDSSKKSSRQNSPANTTAGAVKPGSAKNDRVNPVGNGKTV